MVLRNLINKIIFTEPEKAMEMILNMNQKSYVIFIGLHGISEYLKNPNYRTAVDDAKFIFCDSIFVQFLYFLMNKKIPLKSPGPDVSNLLIKKIIENNHGISFFGGKENLIKQKFTKNKFLNFDIINPGKISNHNIDECRESKKILKLKYEYVFISISCPKQEIIANHFYKLMDGKIIIPVGAAINFYFEIEKRAPLFLRKIGMEFIWRFFLSPIKMGKRIIFSLYNISFYLLFR